jgi:hypothetical protein
MGKEGIFLTNARDFFWLGNTVLISRHLVLMSLPTDIVDMIWPGVDQNAMFVQKRKNLENSAKLYKTVHTKAKKRGERGWKRRGAAG